MFPSKGASEGPREDEERIMSSYFIALIDIHDPGEYERYLKGFNEVFEQYQGTVVSVEDAPRVLEGEWPARRTVILRFPDEEELRAWYESPEYQHLAEHRKNAADCKIAVVSCRD
jgi:uncharacterized protein (DUF1330 family)